MVDEQIVEDPRYVHQGGQPVVQIWGFYFGDQHNPMNAELANRLIDFFRTPDRYSAFLVGGGDWNWRHNPDPAWQKFYRRFGAYCPWNIGNYVPDQSGVKHAATYYWAEDLRECERLGMLWIPVVYPGFSWDNLQRQTPGTSLIPRRGGRFLWEQFRALSPLGLDTVYVAMFDEVDEGTAIFKVTSSSPHKSTLSATMACPATGICGSSEMPHAGCMTNSPSLLKSPSSLKFLARINDFFSVFPLVTKRAIPTATGQHGME
jgi:hypothetical protein